ncbi:MAG TPA: hypothetical protein VF766_01145 [Pyrinomonadaceae bacterium]
MSVLPAFLQRLLVADNGAQPGAHQKALVSDFPGLVELSLKLHKRYD